MRWGKSLVVIIQSEKAPPAGSLDAIQASVRKATRASDMKVRIEPVVTPAQALAARRVIALFMNLATDRR